jgi:hypothetical protein
MGGLPFHAKEGTKPTSQIHSDVSNAKILKSTQGANIRNTNTASLHALQFYSLVRRGPTIIYSCDDYSQEKDNSLG